MQVKCVRPFGLAVPGDLAEVPDGAAVDPEYWEVVPGDGQQSAAGLAPVQAAADGGQPSVPSVPQLPPAPGARAHSHWPPAAKEM